MSVQPFRLPIGGRVDRNRTLDFTFDGKRYQGFAGDSLAAALLANGIRLVGRSFKYHRPRGVLPMIGLPSIVMSITPPQLRIMRSRLKRGKSASSAVVKCAIAGRLLRCA